MKIEEGEAFTTERKADPTAEITRVVTKGKPHWGTMKDRIKILDPNWEAPQNDEAAWLAGDV